jgi:mRNA interferase RelE/StbE
MRWNVFILPPAAAQIAKLDKSIAKRVSRAISALADNARPSGCKKLVGIDAWRIRIGDWRAIYQIKDDKLIVLVVRVGHRRDVYD